MKHLLTHKHNMVMGLASLLLTIGLTGPVQAATIQVDDFTTITNGIFFDLPVDGATGAMFGGVTITGNPAAGGGVSGIGATPTPADPGDGAGWFHTQGPVVLTFDIPVAAFGVSFLVEVPSQSPTVEAFSGANGTGTSLGVVMASCVSCATSNGIIDFVGLWSDALEIQSVVLSAPFDNRLLVDGYGLSLTSSGEQPIPEPSTMILLGTGLAGIIAWRRKQAA